MLTALILVLFSAAVSAQHPVYRATLDGPAIGGYDTVAYFTVGEAVPGSADFQVRWRDTDWYFSNEKHRALFEADPERYAPQFGGYCAYGVAKQHLYKVDPHAFTVVDGKLYLNNTLTIQSKWQSQPRHFIRLAEGLWPQLFDVQGKENDAQ